MSEQYVVTVVLEGNVDSMSKSMDNAASSQRNVKRATDDANLSFIAQIAKYQAMTAALNQTIGGFNKLAGGMDRLGFKEQAAALRKFTAYLEIIAGPAEIYLAYLTLTIAFGKKDVAVKGAQTTATGGLTLATKALTKAMMANPFMAVAVGLTMLITALMVLDGRIKKVTDVLTPLVLIFQKLQDAVEGVFDGINHLQRVMGEFSLDGLNKRLNDSFLGEGGGPDAL
tara:strand:+ start:84 stop:764 length:681 start_codon:yes stop_codon:yes gene_type:complete